MELPKYKDKHRAKDRQKICQEPGCGREYIGHIISKYCEIHRDIRTRKRKRRIYDDPSVSNKVFKHKFHEVTGVEFTCDLPGCNRRYSVRVFPKQYIYPKYCSEHVNVFRRERFLRVSKR